MLGGGVVELSVRAGRRRVMAEFFSTMKIGSIKKFSLVDFPGRRALVVFTQGCDWECPYCHFRSLIRPARFQPPWPEEEVFALLENGAEGLDAVVVSGGEPLVQPGLAWFLRQIKERKMAIKLETNGSRPWVLQELLAEGLVDYVALDVKGPLGNYSKFAGCEVDPGVIELAMEVVRTSGVDYEFRTTLVGGLHSVEEVRALAPLVHGARRFVVQHYRGPEGMGAGFNFSPPSVVLVDAAKAACGAAVGEFIEREVS